MEKLIQLNELENEENEDMDEEDEPMSADAWDEFIWREINGISEGDFLMTDGWDD